MATKLVPFDVGELKKVGVTLLKDGARWLLRCQVCEQTWSIPAMIFDLATYWQCPWGCNTTTEVEQ